VRSTRWDEREPSADVPSPTALAATWDEPRIERLGALLAAECRRKRVDVLLAPTIDLHRTPARRARPPRSRGRSGSPASPRRARPRRVRDCDGRSSADLRQTAELHLA
jgi:hypothetical protein